MYDPIVLIDKADPTALGSAIPRVWEVLSDSDKARITETVGRGLTKLFRRRYAEPVKSDDLVAAETAQAKWLEHLP